MTELDPQQQQQDRRAFLAVMLCIAVFMVWSMVYGPRRPAPPPDTGSATSASVTEPAPAAAAPPASAAPVPVACAGTTVTMQVGAATFALPDCGGGISAITLPDVRASIPANPWWSWIFRRVTGATASPWQPYGETSAVESLMNDGRFAVAGRGDYADPGAFQVVSQDPVVLRGVTPDGLTITQTFARGAEPDLTAVTVRFEADRPVAGPFWVAVADRFQAAASATDSRPGLEAGVDGKLWLLSQKGKASGCSGMWSSLDAEELHGDVGWLGVGDRYFLAALAPEQRDAVKLRYAALEDGRSVGAVVADAASIGPGSPLELDFTLYTGRKDVERLAAVGHDLDAAVSLGLFGFFSKILLFFLALFHRAANNWGAAIILLTVFVRLTFYPLSAAAFRSGKKMQLVQPRLKQIQEEFADDAEGKNRATMELFQKEGVNPLGGCFPMLIQIPVFFALYSGLQATPDLLHASFLYVHDLSSPDPWGVLPGLIFAGMIAQQRMTPMTGLDPQQQTMMRIMPFAFAFGMLGLPAGLSLYYAVNSGLAILQQWYNTRSYQAAPTGVNP